MTTGQSWAQGERSEDATLPVMKTEERPMPQAVQGASRSWKRQQTCSLLRPLGEVQPFDTWILAQ